MLSRQVLAPLLGLIVLLLCTAAERVVVPRKVNCGECDRFGTMMEDIASDAHPDGVGAAEKKAADVQLCVRLPREFHAACRSVIDSYGLDMVAFMIKETPSAICEQVCRHEDEPDVKTRAIRSLASDDDDGHVAASHDDDNDDVHTTTLVDTSDEDEAIERLASGLWGNLGAKSHAHNKHHFAGMGSEMGLSSKGMPLGQVGGPTGQLFSPVMGHDAHGLLYMGGVMGMNGALNPTMDVVKKEIQETGGAPAMGAIGPNGAPIGGAVAPEPAINPSIDPGAPPRQKQFVDRMMENPTCDDPDDFACELKNISVENMNGAMEPPHQPIAATGVAMGAGGTGVVGGGNDGGGGVGPGTSDFATTIINSVAEVHEPRA